MRQVHVSANTVDAGYDVTINDNPERNIWFSGWSFKNTAMWLSSVAVIVPLLAYLTGIVVFGMNSASDMLQCMGVFCINTDSYSNHPFRYFNSLITLTNISFLVSAIFDSQTTLVRYFPYNPAKPEAGIGFLNVTGFSLIFGKGSFCNNM